MAKVKITAEHEFERRRMVMAFYREITPLEGELNRLYAEIDGIDTQIASVQTQMAALAEAGEATPEAVAPLVEREAALGAERLEVGRRQTRLRFEILATRLEDVTADDLEAIVDFGGGQLEELEEQMSRPPASTSTGASSST